MLCTLKLGLPGLVMTNIQKAMENGAFIDGLPIKHGELMITLWDYPLVNIQKAMENGPFISIEIDGLPNFEMMVIFYSTRGQTIGPSNIWTTWDLTPETGLSPVFGAVLVGSVPTASPLPSSDSKLHTSMLDGSRH